MTYFLLRHRDIPDIKNIEVYKKNGGFESLKKVITSMQPQQVVDEVKASGLRGRGGAGFPTGVKWSFLPNTIWPHYVVCNADESEPGTFKDREIMESNPFQFLEGVAIACYAVGALEGFVYLRGEFQQVQLFLDECILEMEKAGVLGDNLFGTQTSLRLKTHLGAGAYICGEETALLESIEGKRGQPRVRPPFPAVVGLYGKPTVINNVETLTNLPFIVEKGAGWYKSLGTEKSSGVKIFSLSGNVNNPGNYELPLGTTFRELLFTHGGGIPDGRKLKAIMPAGASSSIIRVDDSTFDKVMDTPMDYENVQNVGSLLGSASVIVIDDSHSMDWVIDKTVHFFKHESCGKCTPCRDGNYWMLHIVERIHGGHGTTEDLQLLKNVANQVNGKCLCALGDFSTMAVTTALERFPEDFAILVPAAAGAERGRHNDMSKMVNLTIDDVKVTVPEGTLVVDAAKKIGIDIPVFCYHPKMEPVGMCRQCLVEIGRPVIDRATGQPVLDEKGAPKMQYMPKLETACTNPVSEGMSVLTTTEKARSGQKEILELLLTNHPLDCPICDKGGECPLQNLTMAHGPSNSRFLFDEKQRQNKHVALGDLIFLDRERCIQCARCIRFQDKIAGEPVLGFYSRGRSTDIVTFSDPGFDSVFSGNTTDICPVGALTTADFRFGARPWELKNAASVCSQCPVGCNVTFNVRREVKSGGGYVVKRALPRQNEQVNEIWMCDKGRFAGYQYAESAARLSLAPAQLETALARAGEKLAAAKSDVVILAGGRLANEDLFNLKQLATGLGAQAYLYTGMGGGEYTSCYGLSAGSNLGDLGKGDTLLVVASDLYNEAPIWHLRVMAAAKRGATVIVAAARATKLDEFATFVVRYAYGDEVETVNSLAGKEKIGEALSSAVNLVVFFGSDGLGLNGTSAVASACASLVQERAGKVNNGLVGVWSTPNGQGAWELGFRPAPDLAAVLQGKVVYVVAADPAGDDPRLADALKGAKTVIAQDILPNATTEMAEIVLPAAAYTEREGTFTSGERRVQRFYPAVPARPGSRADFALIAALAKKCGIELEGRSSLLVMNKLVVSEKAFAGAAYDKLAEVPEQWPVVGRGDLYYGGTSYENTQGLGAHLALTAAISCEAPARIDALRPREGELVAVPVTKLYDMGAAVAPAKLLESHIGVPAIGLNPVAAVKLGLSNGSLAQISLNGFSQAVTVKFDESISTGVVLVYRSFGFPISAPAAVAISAAEKA